MEKRRGHSLCFVSTRISARFEGSDPWDARRCRVRANERTIGQNDTIGSIFNRQGRLMRVLVGSLRLAELNPVVSWMNHKNPAPYLVISPLMDL